MWNSELMTDLIRNTVVKNARYPNIMKWKYFRWTNSRKFVYKLGFVALMYW